MEALIVMSVSVSVFHHIFRIRVICSAVTSVPMSHAVKTVRTVAQ